MPKGFPDIDVLVVGGGISGLTASFKILKKEPSLKIFIVEADNNIGGNIEKTVNANWVLGNHYHIINLCKELNVKMKRKYFLRPDLKQCWEMSNCNFIARFELKRFLDEIDVKSQLYRPGTYKVDRRSKTMEKYLCSKLFFEHSRAFVRFFVKLLMGASPKNVTKTEFMAMCYSHGGITPVIKLFTGTDLTLINIDVEELLRSIIERINSIIILTERKIVEIVHFTDYAIARDENGNVFQTSVLILAIPWIDIMKINIQPPIPAELQLPVEGEKRYLCTAFTATYIDGYWRKKGYCGSNLQHSLQMIGYEVHPTVFGGIILHNDRSQEVLKDAILETLSDFYGEEMLAPKVWIQKTFEKDIYLNSPLTSPWNRIVWGSNNAATLFRGQINGAVQGGLRAAFHALLILRPQTVAWQDLEEIQKAQVVYQRVSNLKLLTSSLNVFNTFYYLVVTAIVISVFRQRHKLLALIWKSK